MRQILCETNSCIFTIILILMCFHSADFRSVLRQSVWTRSQSRNRQQWCWASRSRIQASAPGPRRGASDTSTWPCPWVTLWDGSRCTSGPRWDWSPSRRSRLWNDTQVYYIWNFIVWLMRIYLMSVTWAAVLFPAFELPDQCFGFTFISPPVGYMRPQLGVAVRYVVLVRDNHLLTRTPQTPQRDHILVEKRSNYSDHHNTQRISKRSPLIIINHR